MKEFAKKNTWKKFKPCKTFHWYRDHDQMVNTLGKRKDRNSFLGKNTNSTVTWFLCYFDVKFVFF